MSSDSTEDTVVWETTLIEGKLANNKQLSLEAFFTTKLGVSAGKRLYKELVATVAEFAPGPVAVDLAAKHGPFVSYRS
jgi:hypothetical protein